MVDTNGTIVIDGKPYYGPVGETSLQIFLEKTFMASGYLTGVGFGKFNTFINMRVPARVI